MSRLVTALRWILPVVLLAGAALVARHLMVSREPPARRAAERPAPLVRVVEVTEQPVRLDVVTHGTVAPRTESRLVARVAGVVEWVAPAFVSGGRFAAGDVLVRLDRRDLELAASSARAALARAELALALEEREAEVAREEWDALGEGEPAPLVARVPQLRSARAAVEAAAAELARIELDLTRTELAAPYDGRVRAVSADIGQFVAPGTPLASVYAIDRAEVRLPVPDAELAFLDLPWGPSPDPEGYPAVTLRAPFAGRTWSWNGRIVRTEAEIDPSSRMLHLVAGVDDPYDVRAPRNGGEVRPPLSVGLFVEATIQGRRMPSAVVLPREALRRDGSVLVVDDDQRLRRREVTLVRAERDRIVVAEGLERGERVCVSILETAVDGMRVRTEDGGATDGGATHGGGTGNDGTGRDGGEREEGVRTGADGAEDGQDGGRGDGRGRRPAGGPGEDAPDEGADG